MDVGEARALLAEVVKKARDKHSDAVAKVDYSVAPDLAKRPWKAWVKSYGEHGAVLCFAQSAARRVHRPAHAITERLEYVVLHHPDPSVAAVAAAHVVLRSTLDVGECNCLLQAAAQRVDDMLGLLIVMAPEPEWGAAKRVAEWAAATGPERAKAWLGPVLPSFPDGTRARVEALLAAPPETLSMPARPPAPSGPPVWSPASADLDAMAASVRDVPVHVMKGAFRAGGLEPVRDEEHGVVLTHERRFGPGLRLVFRHGPLDGTHASIREVGFYSGTSRVPYERVDPHAFSDGAAVLVGLTRG